MKFGGCNYSKNMEKYEVLGQVGEGSFGQVYKAKTRSDGDIVAFKVIRKRGRSDKEIESLRQECKIQRNLHHPNIVLMLDSFETENEIVVVTEFVDKELCDILGKAGRLSEERAQVIACDLVSALYYLHSNRVLHRDLKPQNVLLESSGIAKLCDFGFARSMSTGTHVLTSIKGTPLYMAPELIEECPYDHTADLWSLGCIVYELVVGAPPFQTTSILHLIKLIRFEEVKWPEDISAICKSFLQGLLQKDPSRRLTWPELLEHPFVKDRILRVESPDPTSLTSPLSASQEKAKRQQFKTLAMQSSNKSKEILEKAVMKIQEQEKRIKEQQRHCMSQPHYPAMFNYYHCELNRHFRSRRSEPSGEESNASVDVLLGNLSIRASLQSDILAIDSQINCPNTIPALYPQVAANTLSNSMIQKVVEESPEDIPNITSENPTSNAQHDNCNQNLESSSEIDLQVDEVQKQSRLSINYDQEFNRENIIDKHVRLPDWDPRTVEQPIENDEWVAFLQRSMEEVMEGEFGSLIQQNCVSVFVSPLKNRAAGSQVIEYVACLLALPFVMQTSSEDMEKIKKVYLDVRLIPNLVYAVKLLMGHDEDNEAADKTEKRPASPLSGEKLQAIECVIILLCRLVYIQEQFLTQFCDAVYIISGIPILQQLLTLQKRKPGVVSYLVAILNNVLRSQPENAELVEQVVFRDKSSDTAKKREELLEKLLGHPQSILKARTCTLIRLLGRFCCRALQHVWGKRLKNFLQHLTTDRNSAVRSAAEDALKELQQLPYYEQLASMD